ncbi:MAG: chromate transporter [Erysipelotrichaceae bacterium]|nr:chromate transporter [Erysipelotrichaceae bacterium]
MEKNASLKDLYLSFFRIGLFTFGGGLAMIPMLQREIVDRHHWCSEEEIMNYYAVGQCTPGIIAVNTATFVGNKYRGVPGAIVTTLGVITPSLIIITIIAAFLRNFADLPVVQKALKGLGAGVCAIIIPAIFKLAKGSLTSAVSVILAIISFAVAQFTDIPIYVIVLVGIAAGVLQGIRKVKA